MCVRLAAHQSILGLKQSNVTVTDPGENIAGGDWVLMETWFHVPYKETDRSTNGNDWL